MYQPNPEIEKLHKKQEQGQKKLEQLRHREQQLQNRIRYLEGAERRQRNHRLITRGAAIEHLWPEVKPFTEREFYILMEQVTNLPVAQSILHSVLQSPPKDDGG